MTKNPIGRFRVQVARKPLIRLEARKTTNAVQTDSAGAAVEQPTPVQNTSPPQTEERPAAPSTAKSRIRRQRRPFDRGRLRQRARHDIRRQVMTQVTRGMRLLGMPLVWLGVLAFCGGTGVSAFFWLTTLPPLPNCSRLAPLSSDTDRLYCAEQSARSGKPEALAAGLALVEAWPSEHPLSHRVNRLVNEWSRAVMTIARDRAVQDDLEGAIALAQRIPPKSPLYKEAQQEITAWKKDSRRGRAIEQELLVALERQNWQAAEAKLESLSKLDGDYWQQRLNRLRQRIITERQARWQLEQVRRFPGGAPTSPEAVGQMIALAKQVRSDSYARPEIDAEINRLSQLLFAAITERVARMDLTGAIAIVQLIPSTIWMPPEVREVFWISQAQPLVARTIPKKPLYRQLWQLWLVLPQLRQIQPNSPLYPQAQELAPLLEQQIQDLTQLQAAWSIADLWQIPALQVAIDMAQGIGPDRPQRILAQTLIAQWRKSIEQVEDRPRLGQARALAAAKTIPQLQKAIAIAQQIPLGRALRKEAQAAIFDWQQEIQMIEDRPFLLKARTLAKQQKLTEAIQVGQKIAPGRALYAEAQDAVQAWTGQLQAAEDRPLLDEATALAAQGNLTGAINLAYQIAPNRALYSEAQAAIAQWASQRDANRQEARSPQDSDTSDTVDDEQP